MIKILFSPGWFFDYDIAFDLVSAFVTLLIALYAKKLWKFTEEKRYKYFSFSFLAIGLGFIAKSLTNFVIYHPVEISRRIGFTIINYTATAYSTAPFLFGFLLHRILVVSGLLGIYLIITHFSKRKDIIFLLYFLIIIVSLFSWLAYFVFHIVSLLLAFMIFKEYWHRCRKQHKKRMHQLAFAFLLLTLSQLSFIFVFATRIMYVLGEIIQLTAYLILAWIYYMIIKKR